MAHNASIVRIAPDPGIESAEWIKFAKNHARLVLETTDVPAATAVHVDGPRNLRLFWSDGRICCGAPTRQLIEIMFECAEKLGGVVVGPRNYQYASIEDWEVKTRKSRAIKQAKIEAGIAIQKTRMSMFVKLFVGVIAGILIFWLATK